MSNLFQAVIDDVKQVENELMGPSFSYYSQIKAPELINMSNAGTRTAIDNNITGLGYYIDVLISGTSEATWLQQPLGNKYFMQTGGTCSDPAGNEVTRSIYMNNVPTGDIFIDIGNTGLGSVGGGANGLIPGAIDDLNALNPFTIMQSFLTPNPAPCQSVTLQTIDPYGTLGTETAYLTNIDIQNMSPCDFLPNSTGVQTNPVTGVTCPEGFAQRKNKPKKSSKSLPKDLVGQIYFTGLACVGIYIFYKIMEKS